MTHIIVILAIIIGIISWKIVKSNKQNKNNNIKTNDTCPYNNFHLGETTTHDIPNESKYSGRIINKIKGDTYNGKSQLQAKNNQRIKERY